MNDQMNPYRPHTKRWKIAYHALNGVTQAQAFDALQGKLGLSDSDLRDEISRTYAVLAKKEKQA